MQSPKEAAEHAALERFGDLYRAAYLKHDPSLAPIAKTVRFVENNVEMAFPDASWDTVTSEVGPALTFSDPVTGNVGIFTAVMQNDTPGFLAARLKVVEGKITEIEHMLSTRRGVSGPPTPFGEVTEMVHDPELSEILKPSERVSREEMIALADGYFSTLEHNTGELKTKFGPNCHRVENGKEFPGAEDLFKLGVYRFNERVRDREYFLVDEERGLVMSRAFIDHKGILDYYTLNDGTERRSPFREAHTWSVLELFKVKNGALGPIEAVFIGVAYYLRSPWTKRPA
jgi:hypothetical protein